MTRVYTLRGPSGKPAPRFLDELDPEQREVALAPPGPTLVLAGAGSGKTRALTYKVAKLLHDGVAPERILLVTFTNKAAREMLARVEALCQVQAARLWGGTFHHLANRTLRQHAQRLGYGPEFTIIDRQDSADLVRAAVVAAGVDPKHRRFPKADVVLGLYSFAVNTQTPLDEIVARKYPRLSELVDPLAEACAAYVSMKRAQNVMDYDDLLMNWKVLLQKHPEVLAAQTELLQHLLVDEYQDTNRIQGDILELLASKHRNLCVVGDDAQSIYAFRGADYRNILEYTQRWPDARVLQLTRNYRSTPPILALANTSIARNKSGYPKTLVAMRAGGPNVACVPVRDAMQQAQFVTQRVLELRDQGIALRDMGVLYRAHQHAMELQLELSRRGIPFVVRSGVRFFESAHLKDVVAYLRLAVNAADGLAWRRVLALCRGVGSASLESLCAALAEARQAGRDPVAALASAELLDSAHRTAREPLAELAALVAELRGLAKTPAEMVRRVLESGYARHLELGFRDAPARRADLEQFADYAAQFDDAETLLAELALSGDAQAEDVVHGGDEDEWLVLSSVHQAKGLEWRVVFVVWLCDGRFPSAQALRDPDGEEEERRLFYVAVTRAKDELHLCYPMTHLERGESMVLLPASRFLAELPAGTGDAVFEKWLIAEDPE